MSDASEKPFEATPHRIVKAKREGNVARASELAANLSFVAAVLALVAAAPLLGAVARNALTAFRSGAAPSSSLLIVAFALLPAGAAAAAGILGCALQSGGLTITPIEPKLERLDPVQGVKRILSRETFAHSMRAVLAFSCAAVAMSPCIAWTASALLQASTLPSAAAAVWSGARAVAGAACAVGFIFAIAEYAAARRLWLRKLRMSFDERKREAKEEEGDAIARGRRRALHRALVRGGMRRLRDAAFVVANPQHIAVALEYRPPRVSVPRVLVRAADATALRVRSMADAYAIPVVENVWLARSLYRDGREGEPIPHVHYVAVAEVVSALLRAKEIAR
jgi:flagellar biosynthesis protein FlhB